MNKTKVICIVVCLLGVFFLGMSIPAYSAIGMLDTTTINFSASGSPNTISGSWNASLLNIYDGVAIDYFTVEITDINSNFGSPLGISFDGNSSQLAFCSNPRSCVANAIVGDLRVIDSNSTVMFAWDFMNQLVTGNSPTITSGSSTVSYSSGGSSASISGNVLVHAYGDVPVIPEPISSTLFLVGGATLALRRFLKRGFKDKLT